MKSKSINYNTNIIISSIILSCSILISSLIIYGSVGLIDLLQKLSTIVGSLSLVFALVTYLYTKRQNEISATIGQVSFFRKEIIPEWDNIALQIKEKNKEYRFPRIILYEPSIEFVKGKCIEDFISQSNIFRNDPKITAEQITLLNMIEEFALRVVHFRTQNHEVLNSVKGVFIQLIEQNAALLLFEREIVVANNVYSATLDLYAHWINDVDRRLVEERIEKFNPAKR